MPVAPGVQRRGVVRDPQVGDVLDGYRLVELVARGGMSHVYRAVDPATGAAVALKIPELRFEADVTCHERLRREEELAAAFDHPGLVRALRPAGPRSRQYLVLEYVDGAPLSEVLRQRGPLPVPEALELARQTCEALAWLHARGVVHCDVKPGNVLVTRGGEAKLIDLGIAHVADARRLGLAGLSAPFGTPDYMPPEQMRGRARDPRVDIYALGTMLYELVTGRLPFSGADWQAVARAKRRDDPVPPSAHLPELDRAVEAIILRAIEHAPADRYATAAELLVDLRDPGAVAPRAPRRPRSRWRRLDPRPLAAAAAVAAALGVVGWIGWRVHLKVAEASAVVRPEAAPALTRGAR
jgi:eukaryotic-like serine/threonine-protein kinase